MEKDNELKEVARKYARDMRKQSYERAKEWRRKRAQEEKSRPLTEDELLAKELQRKKAKEVRKRQYEWSKKHRSKNRKPSDRVEDSRDALRDFDLDLQLVSERKDESVDRSMKTPVPKLVLVEN